MRTDGQENSVGAASVVSFHRLRMSPAARLSDLRLLLMDSRTIRRANPGLIGVNVAISGASHRGFGLPPHPLRREVIAFWRDEASYQDFLLSDVHKRWGRTAEVFSAQLEPFVSRGHWNFRDLIETSGKRENPEGPLAIISFVKLDLRAMPAWYGKLLPAIARHMASAPGLLVGTGGADLVARTTFTVTFWDSQRSMIAAAYSKDNAHGSAMTWGKRNLDASFARFRIIRTHGTWDGHQPDLHVNGTAQEERVNTG